MDAAAADMAASPVYRCLRIAQVGATVDIGWGATCAHLSSYVCSLLISDGYMSRECRRPTKRPALYLVRRAKTKFLKKGNEANRKIGFESYGRETILSKDASCIPSTKPGSIFVLLNCEYNSKDKHKLQPVLFVHAKLVVHPVPVDQIGVCSISVRSGPSVSIGSVVECSTRERLRPAQSEGARESQRERERSCKPVRTAVRPHRGSSRAMHSHVVGLCRL